MTILFVTVVKVTRIGGDRCPLHVGQAEVDSKCRDASGTHPINGAQTVARVPCDGLYLAFAYAQWAFWGMTVTGGACVGAHFVAPLSAAAAAGAACGAHRSIICNWRSTMS